MADFEGFVDLDCSAYCMDNAVDYQIFETSEHDSPAVDIVVTHFAQSPDWLGNYRIDYCKMDCVVSPTELDTFD